MATNRKKFGPALQSYPRESSSILSLASLYQKPPSMDDSLIDASIDEAFRRCTINKQGKEKSVCNTPEQLVNLCIKHLKERSDPILIPYFVSQLKADDLFELDAVSHEMQRHRMTIGVFYQYLLLELMRRRWPVFDGSREGDIVADIDTFEFASGLRLYMSVKKSSDTVGGQDVSGVIKRLESLAKEEKNLTRPYLCVVCVATPAKGKIKDYHADRQIKCNQQGQPYSLNCEYWGPGFIFPFITGNSPLTIYSKAVHRVSNYLPFMTIRHRVECTSLLKHKLKALGLLDIDEKIDADCFLKFHTGS